MTLSHGQTGHQSLRVALLSPSDAASQARTPVQTTPGRRHRAGWAVALVAVGLVAAGLGWRVSPSITAPDEPPVAQSSASPAPPGSHPTPTAPAPVPTAPAGPTATTPDPPTAAAMSLSTVPIAWLRHVPPGQPVELIDVSDGIAILLATRPAPTGATSALLRGVNTQTGALAWADDGLGDLVGLTHQAWDGQVAIATVASPRADQPDCPAGTAVVVLSAATGQARASGWYDSGCTADTATVRWTTRELVAYQDDLLVVDLVEHTRRVDCAAPCDSRATRVATAAYHQSDLARARWRLDGASPTPSGADPVVSQAWVATARGSWVALGDGHAAALTTTGEAPAVAVENLVVAGSAPTSYGWVSALTAWAAPDAPAPLWHYQTAPGWTVRAAQPVSCSSPEVLVIREDRRAPGQPPGAVVSVLDARDGTRLWSAPLSYPWSDREFTATCAVVSQGGRLLVGLPSGTGLEFREARTGQLVGQAEGLWRLGTWSRLYPCQDGAVCAVSRDRDLAVPSATVRLITPGAPDQLAGWTGQVVALRPLPDTGGTPGLALTVWDPTGGYQLLIL